MLKFNRSNIQTIRLLIALLLWSSTVAIADGPTTDPQPVISMGNEKAIVVRVEFSGEAVSPISVEVANVPPPNLVGSAEMLSLNLLDANGALLDSFFHWDPRIGETYSGNDLSGTTLDNMSARFVVPFDIRYSRLEIDDLHDESDEPLVVVDLEPTLTFFCTDNASDADCQYDLQLIKEGPHEAVAAGELLNYTLTITNLGDNPAFNVVLTDTLPEGLSFESSDGDCTSAAMNTVNCEIGTLSPAEIVVIALTARVAADHVYISGGPVDVSNTALVTSGAGTDSNPSDNVSDTMTHIISVADLQIVDAALVDVPSVLIAGQATSIIVETTVTNAGPSAPVDTNVLATVTSSGDVIISPPNILRSEMGLGLDELRVLSDEYILECNSGLTKTVNFVYQINPANAEDIDPDLLNNTAATDFVFDCAIPVEIDIRPGNEQNPVNLGARGVLQVAILSNPDYGLDATTIDPATISLEGATVRELGNGNYRVQTRDVNDDGWADIIVHVEIAELQLDETATEATLSATTVDGVSIRGTDFIRVVP